MRRAVRPASSEDLPESKRLRTVGGLAVSLVQTVMVMVTFVQAASQTQVYGYMTGRLIDPKKMEAGRNTEGGRMK